ncbi:fibronectin type III domain-containing protein [Paenibacillus sp. HB172176]|uniref:fibronectin type III domain-containing protein n=1 Tax=Paenibacillus sp. HB172176 TaxID=2493690 RepID=UPI00143ACD4A|nr:fibronectin type III domain-containing protein [Paenibacillus sp. HB172176]
MNVFKMNRKAAFASLLALLLLMSVFGSYAAATPAGPPSPPAGSGIADPSLQDHPLAYAPGPLDNPLKGFLPFFFSKTDYAGGYPHSMEWSYFALNEVMTDANNCGYYDWSMIEQALDEIASRGNHAAIRLYMEYPGGTGSHPGNGIPACLNGDVTMRSNTFWGTTSPDYDDPDLIAALEGFIEAFGDKYDGDPRIGYIHMGLIGLWGEWHTWPFDRDLADGYPDLFPTDASVNAIIDAYDDAFDETKLVIRYPGLGGGHSVEANIGYADDSWPYKEFRSGSTEPKSMTLPVSMGGWSDAFLQLALDNGAENRWMDEVIGGEARPEIQGSMFSNWPTGGGQVSNLKDSIELTHISWMINQQGISGYSASDPGVSEAIRLMGYEYHVTDAYYNDIAAGVPLKVGVSIENLGVAPFYYQWPVKLGLKNAQGDIVKEWDTTWDITKVLPSEVRTFPDWNSGQTYLDLADPQYYEASVGTSGVAGGTYSLVMRVVNSLENVTEASVRDNIEEWQPFLPAKKFRFANADQNADGWLNLGSVAIGAGAPDSTPPSAPTNLAVSAYDSDSVSLTWSPSTDDVGVTGYEVYRDGASAGTTATAAFTDTGLTASTSYLYRVRAVDAAGNRSAFSSALTAATDAQPGDTTPPSAPTNLAVSAHDSSSVSLTWSASTDDVGVAGYNLYVGGMLAASTAAAATQHTLTGLSPATVYTLTVTAVDAAGNESAASNTVTAATDAVQSGVSYEAEASGNTLARGAATASCGNCSGGAKVGYVGNGGELTFNGVYAEEAGTYTLSIGYLTAEARSAELSVNGGTAVTHSFPSTGSWDAVGVSTIDIQLNAGNNSIQLANPSGWAPDFDKIAIEEDDDGGGQGGDTTPPSAPGSLTVDGETPSSVSLSWSAAADDVGVVGYNIYRDGAIAAATGTATAYTDTGLTADTSYSYTVTAVDAAGNESAASNAVQATTEASGGGSGSGGLLLDSFDGTPAWPGANDLGKWAGANGFDNNAGVLDGGALKLTYNNAGWLGSDILQDITAYSKLVIRVKGASGGEQSHFQLQLGGVSGTLGDLSGDTVTTGYKDIEIDLEANGVNRTSPGQLQLSFWHGQSGTVWIDEIRFE